MLFLPHHQAEVCEVLVWRVTIVCELLGFSICERFLNTQFHFLFSRGVNKWGIRPKFPSLVNPPGCFITCQAVGDAAFSFQSEHWLARYYIAYRIS